MFKTLYLIVKRFILSVLFIYAYNKLALPLDVVIPLNLFTICLVSVLGIPSIFMLVLFSIMCI